MTEQLAPNIDEKTVAGFGEELAAFDQTAMTHDEWRGHFEGYFSEFPWAKLPANAEVFDLGCGSGDGLRESPRASTRCTVSIHLTRRSTSRAGGCRISPTSASTAPGQTASRSPMAARTLAIRSLCFTTFPIPPRRWRRACASSSPGRRSWPICITPSTIARHGSARSGGAATCCAAAYRACRSAYARLSRPGSLSGHTSRSRGIDIANFLLNSYKDYSFYTMRTDALDRFGTRLEQRFTRPEIAAMMEASGLVDIRFREGIPYWVACGIKRDR